MATYSTVVTLDNLNAVYQDLRKRIGNIGNIYHVQGSKTWDEFKKLASCTSGYVYNIVLAGDSTDSMDSRIHAGTNILCKNTFSNVTLSEDNWENYFEVLDGMLEEATEDTAGVIKLGGTSNFETGASTTSGETYKTSKGTSTSGVVRRALKLTEGTDSVNNTGDQPDNKGETKSHTGHQAYIDIPVATASTYGVVTNQSQTIGGAKTFNSGVTINGQLSASGDIQLTNNFKVVANGLSVKTITLDGVTISANNGVITFA